MELFGGKNFRPSNAREFHRSYYKQLLYTSRGVIRQKHLERLKTVYSEWEAIAKRRIRQDALNAPKSFRENEVDEQTCDGCGEQHEWTDMECLSMKCASCEAYYNNRPACLGITRDECIQRMTANTGDPANNPNPLAIARPVWICGNCKEVSDDLDSINN